MAAQLTYLGHGSFRLTLPDERVVLIDPWLQDNPGCPASEHQQPRCDVVLITHAHDDHIGSLGGVVEQHKPKVVAMYELTSVLSGMFDAAEYIGMNYGGTVNVDGISVTMTRAYHSSGVTTPGGVRYGGEAAGYVIGVEGLSGIYHAGDTDVFGDMQLIRQMYDPKVLLLPIGDCFTMGPRGAAIAAKYFEPAHIVPMHYGTFPVLTGTPEAFKQELGADLASRVVVMQGGESVDWTSAGLTQ